MRRVLLAAAAGLVLLTAAPAAAENPVLDAEGDADVAEALEEPARLHELCYGYELAVADSDTGVYGGTFTSSNLGAGIPVIDSPQCAGVVLLRADIAYASNFSEQEDSASWQLISSVPEVTIRDVERRLGVSAGDLLDDGKSERVLLNAVLALPSLVSEQTDRPPVVLEPNTEPLPADARPTGTPGSDWLRENGLLLGLCVLLVLAGLAMLVTSRRPAPHPLQRSP